MDKNLIGREEAVRLGLIRINKEEQVRKITLQVLQGSIVSGGETQDQIDGTMARIKAKYSKLFSGLGKLINVDPVHIHVYLTFPPVQQKWRVIPIHYREQFKQHYGTERTRCS